MADIKDIRLLCTQRMSKGNKAEFSAEDVEGAIRNAFFELFGTDRVGDKKFRQGFRKYSADIYAIVEDNIDAIIIDGEARHNAFFMQFVETKFKELGDTNSFYIPSKSELSVARKSRGNWTIERQRIDEGKEIYLPIDMYGIKVYTEFETYMAGRYDFPTLIAKMAVAFDNHIASICYDTFVIALGTLPTIMQHNGAYQEEQVMGVVQAVETANGGQKAYILGTKLGLKKLQASTYAGQLMSSNMKDELNANGYLQEWNGVTCIELPQGFKAGQLVKEDGKPAYIFDDSQLFVFTGGEKPVKLYYEGAEMGKSVSDSTVNEDMTLEEEVIIKYGVGCSYNKLFGKINLI